MNWCIQSSSNLTLNFYLYLKCTENHEACMSQKDKHNFKNLIVVSLLICVMGYNECVKCRTILKSKNILVQASSYNLF